MTSVRARTSWPVDWQWLAAAAVAAVLVATGALFGAWVPLVLAIGLVAVALSLVVPTEYAVIPLLLTAILEDPISKLGLHLFTITIEPADLGVVFVCAYVVALTASRRFELRIPRGSSTVLLLIVLLAMPIMTGLAHGHYWQSTLSWGKVAVYYSAFFVCCLLIPSRRAANRVLMVILGLAVASAAYLLFARVRGIQWESQMSGVWMSQGTVSRGYGLWSATPWYPVGCLIALSYAWLSAARLWSTLVALAVSVGLLVATLSTLLRGDVVAVSAGLLVVLLVSLAPGRLGAVSRPRVALTLCAAFIVLLCMAPFLAHNSFVHLVIERTQSIVEPGDSAPMAASTRQFRLDATSRGISYALRHPLGYGFGSMGPLPNSVEDQMQHWGWHNFVAWLGFSGGIVQLVGVCIAWFLILREVFRRLRTEWEQKWGITAASAVLVCLTVESLVANGLFVARYVTGLAVVVLSLAFVYGDDRTPRQKSHERSR